MAVAEDVFGGHFDLAKQYVDILLSRGIDYGVIGPREADRIWDRHILNSVALAGLVPQGVGVADVGSGAGLPGIPLAILRPDLTVALIEPLLRRSTFLTETVGELGIGRRVSVVRTRAEDHHDRYDVVLARAVAPLERLVGWCAPLLGPSGVLLALKGRSAATELAGAAAALAGRGLTADLLDVRAHPQAESTAVVRVRPAR